MKFIFLALILSSLFSCSSSDDPKALRFIEKGKELLEAKEFSKAYVAFREAQDLELTYETLAQNQRNLSICFKNLNQLDSARVNAKKSFELAEEYSYWFHNNKGEYLLLDKKLKEALDEFRLAKKRDDKRMEIYYNMGLIYSGFFDSSYINLNLAMKYTQAALSFEQNTANKELLADLLFQMENFESAARYYSSLNAQFPKIKAFSFKYGKSLFAAGVEDEGMKIMLDASKGNEHYQAEIKEIIERKKRVEL
jgi:tetratricopeptide (TPR) repeat protein